MDENDFPELAFPCEYPITVIGLDEDDFLGFVIEVINRHAPGLQAELFQTRSSAGGKYLSVSVKIIAESREQINALYAELGGHARVRVAM